MKLLCDACQRLLPPAAWTVEDGALRLVCAGCGATAVVSPSTGSVRPQVPAAVTERVTPPVPAPVTERVTPPVASPDTAGDWLDAEWAALAARWDDPDAHRRLLARAEARDDLAALGRRYKERLDAAPGDAAALRGRDELLKRAAARLLAVPARPASGPKAGRVVAATVLLTAVGFLVVLLVQLLRTGAP